MSVDSLRMLGEDRLEPFWSGLCERTGELSSIRAERPGKKDRIKFDPGIRNLYFVAGLSESGPWFEIRMRPDFPDAEIILSKQEELSRRAGCVFEPNAGTKKERSLRAAAQFDLDDLGVWEHAYAWYEKMLKISSMVCVKQCRRAGILQRMRDA